MRRLLPLLLLVATPAIAGSPPTVSISEQEIARLEKGEVVVRMDAGEDGAGAYTIGIVDIDTPPRQALDAALDFPARVGEVSGLKAAEVYLHDTSVSPEKLGARWEIVVVGKTVTWHQLYDIDRTAGTASYDLDPAKENGIKAANGTYQVIALPDGTSRLVYRSISDAGVYVPGWIKNWLAQGSLVDVLEGIKKRAEAGS